MDLTRERAKKENQKIAYLEKVYSLDMICKIGKTILIFEL